jgi:hypothetical protein
MCVTIQFALFDERIDKECHRVLGEYPEVAKFIARELRKRGVSPYLARELCMFIIKGNGRKYTNPSSERVKHIATVGGCDLREMKRVMVRQCSAYLGLAAELAVFLHLSGKREMIRGYEVNNLIEIFIRAYAMLSGVEFDQRAHVA